MTSQARKISLALASAAICVSFSMPAAAVKEKCPDARYSISSGKCDLQEVFGGNLSHSINGKGRADVELLAVVGGENGVTAPIPEPETYALMLAGLGVVALVVWRRKQR